LSTAVHSLSLGTSDLIHRLIMTSNGQRSKYLPVLAPFCGAVTCPFLFVVHSFILLLDLNFETKDHTHKHIHMHTQCILTSIFQLNLG